MDTDGFVPQARDYTLKPNMVLLLQEVRGGNGAEGQALYLPKVAKSTKTMQSVSVRQLSVLSWVIASACSLSGVASLESGQNKGGGLAR